MIQEKGVSRLFVLALLVFATPGARAAEAEQPLKTGKVAMVFIQSPHQDDAHSRMSHALMYAKQFQSSGMEVVLLFDGNGGARWLAKLEGVPVDIPSKRPGTGDNSPEDLQRLLSLYDEIKKAGIQRIAARGPANKLKLQQSLEARGVRLPATVYGIDLAPYVSNGYQIIIF